MDPITAKGVAHTAGLCIEQTINTQQNPKNWQQAAATSFGYSLGHCAHIVRVQLDYTKR